METIRIDSTLVSGGGNPSSSTVRADAGSIPADASNGQGATIRADVPLIRADAEHTVTTLRHNGIPAISLPSGSQTTLSVGEVRTFNNRTYRVEKILSQSSGEAEVYLLSRGKELLVFKWYFQNFKPKDEILNTLRGLNHPDIVNILESSYHERRFYELQEYAAGGSLDQYLPIQDTERIKRIIMDTVNALQFLHSHGIIHKDIKPANLYCKNSNANDILVADFGISSMLRSEESRLLTSQGLTIGFAAPEMYGIGNKMIVGREVDYYALGVSIIHIWQGKSPFDGLEMHAIANLTTTGKIEFPEDLPKELEKFVKGSITIDYEKRWGYNEIQRWLKGENVPVHFQYATTSAPYLFEKIDGKEVTASTPAELAKLLAQNPERGIKQLYGKTFCPWLQMIDPDLNEKIIDTVESDYPKTHIIGLRKAVYLLAPDLPFKTRNGTSCRTPDEIAGAFEEDADYYAKELGDRHHPFYLYLEAHDEKQRTDAFHKIFSATSPAKRALSMLIVELRGKERYKIGVQEFRTPEQLSACNDDGRLQELLQDENSTLLIWMQGYYKTTGYLETLEAFVKGAISHGIDNRKKIQLGHVIAAFAVKSENLSTCVRTTSLLGTVSPDHSLLQKISDSIRQKVEQLRQENTRIAHNNCVSATKPNAELIMLLLVTLAISSLPLFKIIPQPLADICLKSYMQEAACYLGGAILVVATLLYGNYRRMGIAGWLLWGGLVLALAAYHLFAPWALVMLVSFYPASGVCAALFVPKFYMRWRRVRLFSKSAIQSQLEFSDSIRFDAYKEGVASFRTSSSTQAPTDPARSHTTGGTPSITVPENIATGITVPERSLHFPTLLVRGGGVLAASAAIILSAKLLSVRYDEKLTEISTVQMLTRTVTATTKSEATMRLSASARSKRVATLPKGTKVIILEQKGEWTHVSYKDLDGYIKDTLLQTN
ncbi:MAG: protein kinase [Desulfuromonadales bacterium]